MRQLYKLMLAAVCAGPMAAAPGASARQGQQQNQSENRQLQPGPAENGNNNQQRRGNSGRQQDNAQQPQTGPRRQTQDSAAGMQRPVFNPPAHAGLQRLLQVPVNRYNVISPMSPNIRNPYATSKTALMEGKKLFKAMNCSGCHGPGGGGGMGPPLSDTVWKYGDTPASIYLTIAHGRPDGMPAWGGALPPQAIWALVTYVKTLPRPNTGYSVESKLTGPAKKPPARARAPKKRPSQVPSAHPSKKPSNTAGSSGDNG